MNRTPGLERRTKRRVSQREAPLAVLRKWTRISRAQSPDGETCSLSFLVCRIRGFEDLVATHAAGPDDLCRLVRRAATLMADAVHAHGGMMDRMFPGGFSAYFNATPEAPSHTLSACECAVAILAQAADLNREQAGAEPLSIGIGLNTGPAILGDFGTDDQPLYAAVGPAARRADALERLSATYGAAILAGHAMEKEAERNFAFLQVDHTQGEEGILPVWAMLAPPLSRANPKFLALKSFHAHIFDCLRGRNWNHARALIAQCRALSQANPVLYDFYLDRIAHYETNPPAEDWSCVLLTAAS